MNRLEIRLAMTGNLVRKLLRLFSRSAGEKGSAACQGVPAALDSGLEQQSALLQSAWLQSTIRDVTAIAASVGTNVGQHTSRIADVSQELEAVRQKEPSMLVALATRMLTANEDLQTRLNQAEQTLQEYARQLNEALASARTDALTGLLNRRALDDELQRCIAEFERHGRPAALLLLDVDHFKQFNDQFGHQAGDAVLKRVADILRGQARDTDIIARYGGEEFVVVLTSTTADAVHRRAEQIRAAVSRKEYAFDGQVLYVTASAGLSELLPRQTPAEWLKSADEALYAAKRDGRDCAWSKGLAVVQRLTPAAANEPPATSVPAPRAEVEATTNCSFAPERLEDEAFVRRLDILIGQWKRGGPTLTVLLARLQPAAPGNSLDVPIADFIAAAEELVPEETRITRWQAGVALLLPDTTQQAARRLARQLCEAFGGLPASSYWFQLGLAEGQEGNTALRVLERAAIALAACSAPFEIRVHDGLKAVPVYAPPLVRRTTPGPVDAAPASTGSAG
jgi:diguanylate cyclase